LAGVIDSDYTGEVKVVLSCTKADSAAISAGERIAQLVVVPCVMESSQWVDELDETARGSGGFGSTGTS
jgi:dUTP pyrophosphatase